MQTFLISNKLNKQIKMKINDFEFIDIANLTENTDKNNDSNDEISIKLDTFEAFSKMFVFENKRFDIIKKIHNQLIVEHLRKRQILHMIQNFFE